MLDRLTAGLFKGLSFARGARVFHPDGVAFCGRFEPHPDSEVLRETIERWAERQVMVRFSRAIGLPKGAPDILGVAVKVLDAYGPGEDQDLALASSGWSALPRRLLTFRRGFAGTPFSSVLPYEVEGRRAVVMAAASSDTDGVPFDDLAVAPHAPIDLRLWLEPGDMTLGWLRLAERTPAEVSEDLRVDPWNTGPDLRPVGLFNRLRRPTYAASQDGRGAPAAGVRTHLDP